MASLITLTSTQNKTTLRISWKLCPTDFPDAAHGAIAYAAKLAQAINCELTFLHIQSIFDLSRSGGNRGHMTQFSMMMMMGTKLNLEYLTEHHTGLHTRYRWTGKVMGISMDFTVLVTKWIPGFEKAWETVGESKLIIYSWCRMALNLQPNGNSTKARLSITYKRPEGFWNTLLSILFADIYRIWCLRKMLTDVGKSLNEKVSTSIPAS